MTEKRFTLAYEKGNWWTVRDGDITLWKEEVIHLLNELNDENEQLKQYAQTSKEFTEYVEDFFKKYDIDTVNFNALGEMIDADNFFYEKSLKLEKENEQLKQQIKDMQIRFKRKYDYEFDDIVDELD